MSFGSFCLHALLCFGLLVSGSVHAMSTQHRAPGRDARIAAPSSHDSAQARTLRERAAMHADSTTQHADCCKAATCTCACPAAMVAALPSRGNPRAHWRMEPPGLPLSVYLSPMLYRLIRPPIV
ncbi:MAG: CopL family metal-binding regulatory protein [Rhizobacter sp.]|nr:CopL family metal-binding regulatory protein [Rhizobacter sp.]